MSGTMSKVFLTVLAGASLLGSVEAQATVIYSGPDRNVSYYQHSAGGHSAFSLFGQAADWDDLRLDTFVFEDPGFEREYEFRSLLRSDGNFIQFVLDDPLDVERFDAGMTIDATGVFSDDSHRFFSFLLIHEEDFYFEDEHGEFRNRAGYAGFRMIDGADTYYGWMQVSVEDYDNRNITGTLIDWAYEDTPGMGIAAGATSSVPEPSSASLAIVGIGLFFGRRNRRRRCTSAA